MWRKSKRKNRAKKENKCSDSTFDWWVHAERPFVYVHTYVSNHASTTKGTYATNLSQHLPLFLFILSSSVHSCSSLHVVALFSPRFTRDLRPRPLQFCIRIYSMRSIPFPTCLETVKQSAFLSFVLRSFGCFCVNWIYGTPPQLCHLEVTKERQRKGKGDGMRREKDRGFLRWIQYYELIY